MNKVFVEQPRLHRHRVLKLLLTSISPHKYEEEKSVLLQYRIMEQNKKSADISTNTEKNIFM